MLLTIPPLPRGGCQAGMFAKYLAKIARVVEATLLGNFFERSGIVAQEFLRRAYPLTMNGLGQRQMENAPINSPEIIRITV